MPIKTLTNQYHSINAHLHSHWQAHGGWNNFHNRHIVDIASFLRLPLLDFGYTTNVEIALQFRPSPAPEVESYPYTALSIHRQNDLTPILWVELLASPVSHPESYDTKRKLLLQKKLLLVELIYTLEKVQQGQADGSFSIDTTDNRTAFAGHMGEQSIQFGIDEPFPGIEIHLEGLSITVDSGAIYNSGFLEMVYGLETVDYTQLPANFDSYSQRDRLRIARRMVAVMDAHTNGQDLETGRPLPVPEISLEDALARISAAQ
ncbi:MAG: hypothetical protein AAF653_10390 [Chloroflexota bacterium]